jgi:hypothetical protein
MFKLCHPEQSLAAAFINASCGWFDESQALATEPESRDLSAEIIFNNAITITQTLLKIISAERPLDSALASLRASLGVT